MEDKTPKNSDFGYTCVVISLNAMIDRSLIRLMIFLPGLVLHDIFEKIEKTRKLSNVENE